MKENQTGQGVTFFDTAEVYEDWICLASEQWACPRRACAG